MSLTVDRYGFQLLPPIFWLTYVVFLGRCESVVGCRGRCGTARVEPGNTVGHRV